MTLSVTKEIWFLVESRRKTKNIGVQGLDLFGIQS